MNICISSYASPWFFGPYGQQLRILSEELLSHNYNIYYLLLDMSIPFGVYDLSYMENKIMKEKNNFSIDKNIWSKVKFLGGVQKINGSVISNNLNEILNSQNIKCIIMCCDVNNIYFDEPLNFKSIIWYPNHFSPIDIHNKKKLPNFSHIASLCPTDKKQLQDIFPKKRIEYIPHIMELNREPKDREEIRKKYNIEKDKFVILINAGNYDFQNRKSLDTSIFACNEFIKNKKDIILFIHTYTLKNLNENNQHLKIEGTLRLKDLLNYTQIPKDQIIIHEKIVPYDEILDIIEMSDVLLQASKSEGFGIPIVESQLLGVPVITTKFGAMKDNTFYGISVPYYQKCYDNLSSGIWVTPDTKGIAKALEDIYNKNFDNNKDSAIAKIKSLMSKEVVTKKFIKLIEEEFTIKKSKSKDILTVIKYNSDNFFIDGRSYDELDTSLINSEWVLICKDLIFSKDELTNILSGFHNNDIIFLKIKYLDKYYPTIEDINKGNIIADKMIFCIKTKYLNFIDKSIKGKYINKALFVNFAPNVRTAIAENILCTKNENF